jgi:hypothetical protein
MMNRVLQLLLGISFLFIGGLALLGSSEIARGQLEGFIIENADATSTLSVSPSVGLGNLIAQVAPRIVVQFANSNRILSLKLIPQSMLTRLSQVTPRLVMEFADGNRLFQLNYPVDLIDDQAPPQVSGVSAVAGGGGAAVISWSTDEFADSVVEYGLQPNNYTNVVSDPLYVKDHSIRLTGIAFDRTYYYRISSTDQSGNTYRSQELSFEIAEEQKILLPTILK